MKHLLKRVVVFKHEDKRSNGGFQSTMEHLGRTHIIAKVILKHGAGCMTSLLERMVKLQMGEKVKD